jgi:hypothetical protein
MRSIFSVLCLLGVASQVPGAENSPEFTPDIAPLFTKYCTGCHNDTDREGKLSLASYESLLKGGEKGGVITPGQPDLSRLVRVLTGQAEPKMPPEGEESPTPAELETIKHWIAAGAKGPVGGTLARWQVAGDRPARRSRVAVAAGPQTAPHAQ